jgi:hypothetical protein
LLKKIPIEQGHYESIDSYFAVDQEIDEPALTGGVAVSNSWAPKRTDAWTSESRPNNYETVSPSEGTYDRLVVTLGRTTAADLEYDATSSSLYDRAENSQQTMYDRADPSQQAMYDRADPSQQAMYDRADPSQQAMYDRADPSQQAMYDRAEPSQQAMYDRAEPSQQAMYDRAAATVVRHNTVFSQPSASSAPKRVLHLQGFEE